MRFLKSRSGPVAIAIVVLALALLPTVSRTDGTEDSEITRTLLGRIAALEARVAALEKVATVRTIPVPTAPAPSAPIPQQRVPEGWSQREFNGSYYYIVPLEHEKNRQ